MKAKELRALISQWPDDADVEISVPMVDSDGFPDEMEEHYWIKINDVEQMDSDLDDINSHCLIYGGETTMR